MGEVIRHDMLLSGRAIIYKSGLRIHLSSRNHHHLKMSNTLPPLPYAYDALEPYISKQIMTLHHTKHHQTYVNALNAAEAAYAKSSTPKERIALQAALKFNGGGV